MRLRKWTIIDMQNLHRHHEAQGDENLCLTPNRSTTGNHVMKPDASLEKSERCVDRRGGVRPTRLSGGLFELSNG